MTTVRINFRELWELDRIRKNWRFNEKELTINELVQKAVDGFIADIKMKEREAEEYRNKK